ncbi:hypothetical protein ACGF5M_04295 [Gemmatimonadota bacterium]
MSSQATRNFLFTMLCVFLLTACQGPGTRGEAFEAVDSAGVTIVESARPLWGKGEGWTLTPEPEVVIGLMEGDESYLLNEVRGVRRLSDGRIAVLDAGSHRVRVYARTGAHLVDLGGEGDGPSEFRTPQFLGLVSDTLFVYEAIGGALTWFTPDGQLLRTSGGFSQADRVIGTLLMFGYLEDRFGIGTRTGGARYRTLELGINREPWSIWRFGLDNQGVDSLFSVPGGEVEILSSDARGTLQRRYVFGKFTCLAASKNRVYVGPTDEFSIQVFDKDGRLRRILRRNEAPHRVSRSDFNRWVDQTIAKRDADSDETAEMRQTAGELKVAETMPAFRAIVVDSEENLWVEEWEGVGLDQGRFSVFRSDGAWLGYVEIPEGLHQQRGSFTEQLIEIGSDYLLGVWTDELGVEQVRSYRIEKG